MKYKITTKKKVGIDFEGYRFGSLKDRPNMYRCTVKSCPGRLKINNNVTVLITEHNHTDKSLMKTECKRKVVELAKTNLSTSKVSVKHLNRLTYQNSNKYKAQNT
jgi:hypothetical protein